MKNWKLPQLETGPHTRFPRPKLAVDLKKVHKPVDTPPRTAGNRAPLV